MCELCKIYLDNGEEILLFFLVCFIKFKLLVIKVNDFKRREIEKKVSLVEGNGFKC